MAVALETFVKQLADSGVIVPGKLQNFIPPMATPKDAAELARQLVQSKQLTRYQAQEILQGRGKSLILGNYTILDNIGAGGMGQVFKAEHRRMERIVAIKMLPPATMKIAAAMARFQREVKAAAKLTHANIVAAYDADEAGGVHFLVMEYVEGADLSALVKSKGPLPVAKAVDCILQAARGLEFAHKKGVIHRDIKPANLLLDKEGVVKILDMGLARIQFSGEDEFATRSELTGNGAVMGTVDYMPPEQALDAKHADHRADIYSLGCTLHYLLTSKPTYEADSTTAKLLAHQNSLIPDIRKLRKEVPGRLQAVFQKMVAKKVEDRYQTMNEVVAELDKCGMGPGQSAPPPPNALAGTTRLSKPTNKVVRPSVEGGFMNKKPALIAAGATGFLAVLFAVTGIFWNQKGKEIGRIESPPNHVAEATQFTDKPITTYKDPAFIQWTKDVAALPAEKQLEAVVKKLQQLNPGFDGKVTRYGIEGTPMIVDGVVTRIRIYTDNVTDISPLRALTRLNALSCGGSAGKTGKLVDLRPLKGMPITNLNCSSNQVSDLSPLQGMTLSSLICGGDGSRLSDLSPLTGMPLQALHCSGSQVSDLSPLQGMKLLISLDCHSTQVVDLTPLQGMKLTTLKCSVSDLSPLKRVPLTSLWCNNSQVSDLSPLQGMPLTELRIEYTQVSDLSPLRGMPLMELHCYRTQVSDLSPLEDCKNLKMLYVKSTKATAAGVAALQKALPNCKIDWDDPAKPKKPEPEANDKPASAVGDPSFQQWMSDVAALPAKKQIDAVSKKLRELNPGFDGKVMGADGKGTPITEESVITELVFSVDNVTDISPVQVLVGLKSLICTGSRIGKGKLSDLSPLQGMPLTKLVCQNSQVSDLSPLAGMPLTSLIISGTSVSDLSPLAGMPLTTLWCRTTQVSDLAPLEDCKGLTSLNVQDTKVTSADVAALQKALPTCKIAWDDPAEPSTPQPVLTPREGGRRPDLGGASVFRILNTGLAKFLDAVGANPGTSDAKDCTNQGSCGWELQELDDGFRLQNAFTKRYLDTNQEGTKVESSERFSGKGMVWVLLKLPNDPEERMTIMNFLTKKYLGCNGDGKLAFVDTPANGDYWKLE